MEKQIQEIIKKVRQIGAYNPDIVEIVDRNAHINIVEKNGKLILSSINFCWYENLVVCETSMVLHGEHGNNKVICRYKNWDELLAM